MLPQGGGKYVVGISDRCCRWNIERGKPVARVLGSWVKQMSSLVLDLADSDLGSTTVRIAECRAM